MPLELEVINVSQLTWANAHAQVPAALGRRCLIEVPDGRDADAAERRADPRAERDRAAARRRGAGDAAPRDRP